MKCCCCSFFVVVVFGGGVGGCGVGVDDDHGVWNGQQTKAHLHVVMWYAIVLWVIAPHMPSNEMNTILSNVYIAHLRQECHNSKFGVFELLV